MKVLKRTAALMLALVMVLSLAACHKKGEIALTIGDVKFTSAYYMCALINADIEAKNKVQEDLTEEESSGEKEVDYYSKKIDGKKYVTWVEDTAMSNLKKVAAYKTLCKENDLKVTDEQKKSAEEYVSYYWTNYGYQAYFEPNGVSEDTYRQYTEDNNYAENYFQFVYGEKGSKAIPAADVSKTTLEKFILVDILQASYTDLTDDQKVARKKLMEQNATLINEGKKTFDQAFHEFNSDADEHTHEEDTSKTQPVNIHANVFGAEGTAYESEYFDKFKDYTIDKAQVYDIEDGSGCMIVIKRDMAADKYYMENLDSVARHIIGDKEFEKDMEKYIKDLKVDTNKYAVKQFKVKKIIVPEQSGS